MIGTEHSQYNSLIARRIEDWKNRLIDFSRRNSLLYWKPTKSSSLIISAPDTEAIFKRLVDSRRPWEFWLPPEEPLDNSLFNFKDIRSINRPYLKANQLFCEGMKRTDIERILKNLARRSSSDYMERGVRILHVFFGMLAWKEEANADEIRSPLILVPVELDRESVKDPFQISIPPVEDEVILNPALQVRLANDFKIELPALPEEWDNQSLADYFGLVTEKVRSLGWRVEETTGIGLFSFNRLVIFEDLKTNAPQIMEHLIVRRLAGDKSVDLASDSLPEEKDIDAIEIPEKTFHVLDADSSQRICVDYALRGQSFIMQGPPGTGKSQTIANIIGECIAKGNSVLFVSDKMAALDVVYKRLSEVGLASFCLPLHSQKANKQEVVAELKHCLDEQLKPRRLPSKDAFERMTQLRTKLNEYVISLHEKRSPLDKSAYEALGALSTLEKIPYLPVRLSNPRELTSQQILELEEITTRLANVWEVVEKPDFPWIGYKASDYNAEIRQELSTFLDGPISAIDSLRSESTRYSSQLGLDAPSNLVQEEWLVKVSNLLAESPHPESEWVTRPDLDQIISEAEECKAICDFCFGMRSSLNEQYSDAVFNLPPDGSKQIENVLFDLSGLLSSKDLKVNEFLQKQWELADLLKDFSDQLKEWADLTKELNEILGFQTGGTTLDRIRQLIRIVSLTDSEHKPETDWFKSDGLSRLRQMLPQTKSDYEEYNSIKNRLNKAYSERFYDLNLDTLIESYQGPYRSPLRFFNSSFRRDQKEITSTSHTGRVPDTILEDLKQARLWESLKNKIDTNADSVRNILGHYYSEYETDFKNVEKAIEVAAEIIELSDTYPIPPAVVDLASYGSKPSPRVKQIRDSLQKTLDEWEQKAAKMASLLPLTNIPVSKLDIHKTQLPLLQEWTEKTGERLDTLCKLTKEMLEQCKSQPKNYEQLLEDITDAEDVKRKEGDIHSQSEELRKAFGPHFKGLDTDWAKTLSLLEWTKNLQSLFGTRRIPPEFVDAVSGKSSSPTNNELIRYYDASMENLDRLESRFEVTPTYGGNVLRTLSTETILDRIRFLKSRVDSLQVWVDFNKVKELFSEKGLGDFFASLIKNPPAAVQLVDILRRGVYQQWVESIYEEDPNLGKFRRENHEQVIADFRRIDKELINLSRYRIIEEANTRKPQNIMVRARDSEISVLSREASKKRRLMPIRILFQNIPNLLRSLKPCLLMSPISVSQFLSPELKFDLILFDEASQIVPEDAICSIYRGKAIVVAGDRQQLPPTPFFQKSMMDETDWDDIVEDVEVFDSILDECQGIQLPSKTLRWHYRSKNEELIAFSNHRFYHDHLITFPAALAKTEALGVKWVYVPDGVYDRGGRRDNLKEAEAVADLVFKHFEQYPQKTLGVVTLNLPQKEAVEDAIENQLIEKSQFEKFFREDRLQGFFVKNLENVQGDERDVIILSIGYGRDQQHRMTMGFGPLNKSGGERRLNVAITRAREKVILVSSIKSSDIDESSGASGTLTLRSYLDYAEKGPSALEYDTHQGGELESPLEEDVAAEIRSMGFEVVPQVGCSGYRIDIGVVDPKQPGSYLLGVECDGATYHSAYGARDRDRLRQQVLESLGWRVHRIWSPTWVDRRESEIQRLRTAIERACKERQEDPEPNHDCPRNEKDAHPDNEQEAEASNGPLDVTVQKMEFKEVKQIGVPYKVCTLKASYSPFAVIPTRRSPYRTRIENQFHMVENRGEQSRLLAQLVEKEGPIHFDYAVERLIDAWGAKRAGPRITAAIHEATRICQRKNLLTIKGSFLWPVGLRYVPMRVPVQGEPFSFRKIEHIPPEEIEKAMELIAKYALSLSAESLIVETARIFGFERTGDLIEEELDKTYQRLLQRGKLVSTNGIVTLPSIN